MNQVTLPTIKNVTNETSIENKTTICSLYSSMEGDYCGALIYCERVSASLSIFGCIVTLAILLFYKRYMEYSQRLILNLCVAALLEAICFYFVNKDSTVLIETDGQSTTICILQAAWMLYCLWAVLLWTLFIAVNLLLNIVWSKSLKKYELVLSFLCWAIPGIIVSIPFFFDEYQTGSTLYSPSGPWCWVNDDYLLWKIGLWYAWAFISFVGLFVLIVYKNCKRGVTSAEGALYFSFKWQTPVVIHDIHIIRAHHAIFFFLILVLFPFINDIYYAIHHEYVFSLVLLEALSVPFVGGAITVSFMIDKSTRYVLHPKVISEILRRRFKVIEELFREERTTSCDTFMIDIFASQASGEASSRESTASHYFERHGNAELLDILKDEISDLRQMDNANPGVTMRNKTPETVQGETPESPNKITVQVFDMFDIRQVDSQGVRPVLERHRSRTSAFGSNFDGTKLHYIEESNC